MRTCSLRTHGDADSCASDSRLRSVAASAFVLVSPASGLLCRYALTAMNAACQITTYRYGHTWLLCISGRQGDAREGNGSVKGACASHIRGQGCTAYEPTGPIHQTVVMLLTN